MPQVIIIPEVKCYHYCSARQMLLLMSNIVIELLKSYIVLKFPKSKIVIKFLKSDNVADIRYLVQYEALVIEASFAIAYCIEQYFSLYFSRCADATPIDTS